MSDVPRSSQTLDDATVADWADRLIVAERDRRAIAKLSDAHPDATPDDAYRIQLAVARHRPPTRDMDRLDVVCGSEVCRSRH